MSADIRRAHKEALQGKAARRAYDSMCRDYRARRGELNPHAELMIYNIAQLEDYKAAYQQDIATRGVVVPVKNGRQTFVRPNKSVAELEKLMERQARLSARLGMVKDTAAPADGDDGKETLDDFDGG